MKTFAYAFFLLFLFQSFTPASPLTEDVCLSPEEKKLYDLIMQYRKSKKLGSIPLSAKLTQVAQIHARDLATNYTHDPENNPCNPHSWSTKGKWTSCCYTSDHKEKECMWNKPKEITGYPSIGFEIAYYSSLGANAQEGLDGWKVSPGHNPLLINNGIWSKVKWEAIGIGIYKEYGIVWFGEVKDDSKCEGIPPSRVPN
ncbi:MAG TPA: CAP domain-containing protein [Ohtaekwangia sp.]